MQDDAYRMLGLGPDADGRDLEEAYWRRARELGERRAGDPNAAAELERLNEAYQAVTSQPERRLREQANGRSARRLGRLALAAAGLVAVGAMAVGGVSYRNDIQDTGSVGIERAQEGWGDTITWLQSFGPQTTPTAEAPLPP